MCVSARAFMCVKPGNELQCDFVVIYAYNKHENIADENIWSSVHIRV